MSVSTAPAAITPPQVTVVMATFNAAATLRRALDSVLAQQGVTVDVVVMDGGSSDGTAAILAAYADRLGYWESTPDRGIYHAWNKALAHAKGDWLHFLGADDQYWDDQALARLVARIPAADAEGAGLIYGQVAMLDHGQPFAVLGKPWAAVQARALDKMPFPHPGVLHRRSLFARYGGFDESFRIAGDYEWFCRVLPHESAVDVADAIVVGMALGGASTDPRKLDRVAAENQRARQKNGLGQRPLSAYARLLHHAARLLPRCLPERWLQALIKHYYRRESVQTPAPALPATFLREQP